jgi:hypothetical protein
VRKTLGNPVDRGEIRSRLTRLSPEDQARWGRMSVHQMICHVNDAYKHPLGEKTASLATGLVQRTLLKWAALRAPIQWAKGYSTRPEMEQGKGGSVPVTFAIDHASLLSTFDRFCSTLPMPIAPHPIFGR